uniref:Iduronate 2-sulfatase n=1 Tax=Hadrurus spadix TaxID=141984 RepID=A0A1W7RAC6_9SCOR
MADMSDRQTLHKRSLWVCVGVIILVLATGGVMIAIHLTIKDDEPTLPKPTNVLFIVVDDLRPALESYGDENVIAPNIKQLAARSIKFNRAYSQFAMCAPSRNSFLTSRRPDTLHLYDTRSYWRTAVGNFTTLPQHFKEHGFHTVSIGKIFHSGPSSGDDDDYPYSWSEKPYRPSTIKYKNSAVCPTKDGTLARNLYCPVNVDEQEEHTLPDLQSNAQAIEFLQNYSDPTLRSEDKPFFLAVGYYKPHIPFKFPKQYEDLYPSMPLAPNRYKPDKMPDVAWNPWVDVRSRDDVQKLNVSFPFGPLPDDFQKLARIGYYASISYIDDLIGELLATLQETGFAQNTMIVFTGDHGWSLGEHQEWAKYSNFDDVVRVPLFVSIPKATDVNAEPFRHISVLNETVKYPAALQTDELVELVDLFPTLTDVMHLPTPPYCPLDSGSSVFCTEGRSFKPLIQHVIAEQNYIEKFSWKKAAFSQYPRPSAFPQNNSDLPLLKDIKIMGYTMKTKQYRYTEWIHFSPDTFQGNWSILYAQELYDHYRDEKEDNNVAEKPENEKLVKQLSKQLQKGWRSSVPSR